MPTRPRSPFLVAILAALAMACGKSSPTAPTLSRGSVYGTIISSVGAAPIPGATVRVAGRQSSGGTTTTDGNGYYSVADVTDGQVTVSASAAGFADNARTCEVSGNSQCSVSLSPQAHFAVFGVVRDASTNQPLPGASVATGGLSASTDGAGFYHLAGLGGLVSLTWSKPGYAARTEQLTFDVQRDVTLTPQPPQPPSSPQVEYRITGTARRCSVTYENQSGSVSQAPVTIPWSYSRTARTGDFLYVSCQIDTSGDRGGITVAIYKSGGLYRSATASEFPNIATTSGSY